MALYQQQIIETRNVVVTYTVEADSADDAAHKAVLGETVREQADVDCDEVVARAPMGVPEPCEAMPPVESGEIDGCPVCRSENIDSTGFPADSFDHATISYVCHECGSEWDQHYAVEHTPTKCEITVDARTKNEAQA